MTDHDHPDTDLTDPHGEAEALRKENERLRKERDAAATDVVDFSEIAASVIEEMSKKPGTTWGQVKAAIRALGDIGDRNAHRLTTARAEAAEAALAASRAPDPVANAGTFYIDCEFDGHNGPILSMAMVRGDGFGLHVKVQQEARDPWVVENVMPLMDMHSAEVSKEVAPNDLGQALRDFIGTCQRPTIIADSPVDVAHFCRVISTGPNGGWASVDYPGMTFIVQNVDCYPTSLPGAVQHNAWWDAMALRAASRALPAAPVAEAQPVDAPRSGLAESMDSTTHFNNETSVLTNDPKRESTTPGGAELDALVARLQGPAASRIGLLREAADAITALRAQPDWKALSERLGNLLRGAVDEDPDCYHNGTAWHTSTAAALSDLAKMKGNEGWSGP